MASLIHRGLTQEGLAADVAANGEDALWMSGAHDYDVIVLDVMLPGIDGFEICRRLRKNGIWAPVLMLTARDSVEDRVAGLDTGADDYLVKPFAFAELLARLRALARRGEAERPSVLDGLPADGLHAELEALKSDTMLWQFQVSCLRYCGFVHMHHHAEDTQFFDDLEQTNPAITPVIDPLKADHRAVSDYLDAVEAAARALTDDDSHDARRAVADALAVLEEHLLVHLDYEERNLEVTARRLRDFAVG